MKVSFKLLFTSLVLLLALSCESNEERAERHKSDYGYDLDKYMGLEDYSHYLGCNYSDVIDVYGMPSGITKVQRESGTSYVLEYGLFNSSRGNYAYCLLVKDSIVVEISSRK